MMRPIFLLVAALLAWPGHTLLAADPSSIETFIGRWKVSEITSAAGDAAPDALSVRIEADADGFRMSWHDLGTSGDGGLGSEDVDARFLPSGRAGVFEYAPKSSSLLERMFASPATGNPLDGETLLWARIDGPVLAVYSMKIDPKGGFGLDHYSWTRIEDRLHLSFSKRTEDLGSATVIQGQLVKEGE
ncbi:MAG: hypothetical protein OEU92_06965 [Alphaproteobacteria bacterium]|nr:hypothetical protein [Alphaproteobacteria bacterium]